MLLREGTFSSARQPKPQAQSHVWVLKHMMSLTLRNQNYEALVLLHVVGFIVVFSMNAIYGFRRLLRRR